MTTSDFRIWFLSSYRDSFTFSDAQVTSAIKIKHVMIKLTRVGYTIVLKTKKANAIAKTTPS